MGDGGFASIAHFDGTHWSLMGAGINDQLGAVRAVGQFGTNIIVGGNFNRQAVASWDGWNWSLPAATNVTGQVLALASTPETLYAAGSFNPFNTATGTTIAGYNGTNWFPLGEGLPAAGLSLAARGAELFAGHRNGIAVWDGSKWEIPGDGLAGEVRTLCLDHQNVLAGGTFTNAGSATMNHVARWDGNVWSGLGDGIDGNVNALLAFNHIVYAGGEFRSVNGTSAKGLAKWEGNQWSSLGNDFLSDDALVYALGISADGVLYVGGKVRTFGKPQLAAIARFDGTNWTVLGSGTGLVAGLWPTVYSIAFRAGNMLVGGDFFPVPSTIAGPRDNYSTLFSSWKIDGPMLVPEVKLPSKTLNGGTTSCVLSVLNSSGEVARDSTLRMTIPESAAFVVEGKAIEIVGSSLTWRVGDLSPGEKRTVTLPLTATSNSPVFVVDDYFASDQNGRTYRGTASYMTILAAPSFRLKDPRLQNGTFKLLVEGTRGLSLILEDSEDCRQWQKVMTFDLVQADRLLDIDVSQTQRARFFRVREN